MSSSTKQQEIDAAITELYDSIDKLQAFIKAKGLNSSPEYIALNFKIAHQKKHAVSFVANHVYLQLM